jgi:hypothetical protein
MHLMPGWYRLEAVDTDDRRALMSIAGPYLNRNAEN